jgi:hypothetical protein
MSEDERLLALPEEELSHTEAWATMELYEAHRDASMSALDADDDLDAVT